MASADRTEGQPDMAGDPAVRKPSSRISGEASPSGPTGGVTGSGVDMHDDAMCRSLASVGIQTLELSHEIFDPIRYVKLVLSNLSNPDVKITEEDRARYVRQSLERISNVVMWTERMRGISRSLAGARSTNIESVDIKKSLLDIKAGLSGVLESLEITMTDPVLNDGITHIRMNKASFESIFTNLLTNSIRALKGVAGKERLVRITAHRDGRDIVFTFEDNGCGIPKEHRDDIFRPFFTTHNKHADGGSGLGLAILKDIVEVDHGGSIRLAEPSLGSYEADAGHTVFEIRLPAGNDHV
ncbi:MAG: HAMP domain-containing histidine kinase [Nitrosopumilus sp.]|nr:HAMP domain-containing histidine kinase [Nitrosopumilus sp.]